jgi:hypothetical protein
VSLCHASRYIVLRYSGWARLGRGMRASAGPASAAPLARAALALYPPSWRARYGDEVRALLDDSGGGLAAVASVAWRALPAWIWPPRHLHDRPARMRSSLATALLSWSMLAGLGLVFAQLTQLQGAATGMALMGAGSLVPTQVSVHGSYFPDIFFGLLLCGLGIGLAFVTATVAALAGVAEHESGLASGLSNTALQIGTALGVAIVSTVAVSRSADYLAANTGANPLLVLTAGYQAAFVACAVLAGIGLVLALLLPGGPRPAAHEQPEPVLATGVGN